METLQELIDKLPSHEDLVKAAIGGLRVNPPYLRRALHRTPAPLWSRVGNLFGHGSGYSIAICRKYGFNPDETWRD